MKHGLLVAGIIAGLLALPRAADAQEILTLNLDMTVGQNQAPTDNSTAFTPRIRIDIPAGEFVKFDIQWGLTTVSLVRPPTEASRPSAIRSQACSTRTSA